MSNKETLRQQQQILMDTMTAMRKLNLSVLSTKLSHAEFGTLKCIVKCGEEKNGRVSDVVKMLGAPPPAVSRTLKNLETKGYIERTVDKEDRRNIFVEATEEGKKVLDETMNEMWDFADSVFENMGEDSLIKLNKFMNQLLESAKKELEKRKNEMMKGEKASE